MGRRLVGWESEIVGKSVEDLEVAWRSHEDGAPLVLDGVAGERGQRLSGAGGYAAHA